MTHPDQIRQELDALRERVTLLESQVIYVKSDMSTARAVANEADRKTSYNQTEIREGFTKINADLAQITALLNASATQPGRF